MYSHGPWAGWPGWAVLCAPSPARGRQRGPEAAGGQREPGLLSPPPRPGYLELPEELRDLSAVQLLAGLLVGTNDLIHGHVLGCGHRGPRPVTPHTPGPLHPLPPPGLCQRSLPPTPSLHNKMPLPTTHWVLSSVQGPSLPPLPRGAAKRATPSLQVSPRLLEQLHTNITQLVSQNFSACHSSPPLDGEPRKGRAGSIFVTTLSPCCPA